MFSRIEYEDEPSSTCYDVYHVVRHGPPARTAIVEDEHSPHVSRLQISGLCYQKVAIVYATTLVDVQWLTTSFHYPWGENCHVSLTTRFPHPRSTRPGDVIVNQHNQAWIVTAYGFHPLDCFHTI